MEQPQAHSQGAGAEGGFLRDLALSGTWALLSPEVPGLFLSDVPLHWSLCPGLVMD